MTDQETVRKVREALDRAKNRKQEIIRRLKDKREEWEEKE